MRNHCTGNDSQLWMFTPYRISRVSERVKSIYQTCIDYPSAILCEPLQYEEVAAICSKLNALHFWRYHWLQTHSFCRARTLGYFILSIRLLFWNLFSFEISKNMNTRFNTFREREAEACSLRGESKFRPRKWKKSLCCTVLVIGLVIFLLENVG